MIKKISLLFTLLALLSTSPSYAVSVGYHWTAPTEGSEVAYYDVAVQLAGGEWLDTGINVIVPEVFIEQESNVLYSIRVRGVDDEGHTGPWSDGSIPYNYTSPGWCGTPERN